MTEEKKLDDIVLYGTQTCHKCTAVENMLKEKRVEYKMVMVGSGINVQVFVKQFGVQYVPVMTVNKKPYTDYNDIIEYVNGL